MLARRVVVVVAPESIINTSVRTVATEDDTRAALLESFRRAGALGANAQTTADANNAFALVDNAMWALKLLEEGALGEESSDSGNDNNNNNDEDEEDEEGHEGVGGSAAEEMDWETEDDNDNDAGSASTPVAPGASNAAIAGPRTARWHYVAGDEFPWRCLLCPAHSGIKNKSSMVRHFNLTHGLEGVHLPQNL